MDAITVTSNLQMQDIFEEVDSDEKLQTLVQKVTSGKELKPGYTVISGRLFYKKRLVLPRTSSFVLVILKEYHDGFLGGHSGTLKTIKRIQRLFHWANMKSDIQRYVAECSVCQKHKYSTLKPPGLLQPIPIPTQIWTELFMDFIEGLPKSEGKM